MKRFVKTPLFSSLLLSLVLVAGGNAGANERPNLKQTMKQMQLQYKEAMDSHSPERFNQHLDAFKMNLNQAKAFNFSPERKAVSLEGLNKVETLVADLPLATADNLTELKQQLSEIDTLRKEYHKKAKPSTWELILSIFK